MSDPPCYHKTKTIMKYLQNGDSINAKFLAHPRLRLGPITPSPSVCVCVSPCVSGSLVGVAFYTGTVPPGVAYGRLMSASVAKTCENSPPTAGFQRQRKFQLFGGSPRK